MVSRRSDGFHWLFADTLVQHGGVDLAERSTCSSARSVRAGRLWFALWSIRWVLWSSVLSFDEHLLAQHLSKTHFMTTHRHCEKQHNKIDQNTDTATSKSPRRPVDQHDSCTHLVTRLDVRQTVSSRNRLSSLNLFACSSRSAQRLSRLPPNLGLRRL